MVSQDPSEIDKLVELAKQDTENRRLTDVEQFCVDIGVKASSTERVDQQLIYWAYTKWCNARNYKPVTRNMFFKQFKKLYTYNKHQPTAKYEVEKAPFEISKEEWWEMRRAWVYEKQKRQKTKK